MGRTWIRQDVQIASTTTTTAGYTDNTAPSLANYQTNASTLTDDLNNLRSSVNNLLDLRTGNWYDDISTPSTFENGAQRGVEDLNQDLHDYERKRVLREVSLLTDVSVTAYVAATGTLSLNSQVSNNDTVTTGTHTYTFKTALTPLADEVLIGATASDSLDNLISAINNAPGGAGSGTLWAAATTANGFVTAAAGAGDTMDVTAIIPGTQGNLIATTETMTDVLSIWTNGALLTGGTGDVEILLIGELPTQTTAAIGTVTTLGTVAAYDATFGTVSATAVVTAGTAVAPANMVEIVDGSTRDPILDGDGKRIWGLFQTESNTDGFTMTGTTPNRAQISFVVLNDTGDGLEAVDATYIGGKTINYTYVERKALEDLNEYDFLRGAALDIGSGAATLTRQAGYTNQGTTPVDLVTNATLDLEGAGLQWIIRDDLEANLFRIVEGSAGGTSEVEIGSDVDLYDNNAVDVDFNAGITARSGGTRPIDVGVNDGMIETTAGDFEIQAASELWFDDGNRPAGWSLTTGILLSDTAQEWTDFEANFGEVSLMDAINKAYEDQVRSKVQAVMTANVAADTDVNGPTYDNNTDVDLLPYDSVPTSFVADVEVFLNGELLRNAANDGGGEDVYPGGTPADGDLKFQFALRGTGANPDQLTVIVNGQ
jgi:hypothetical protein